MFNEVERHDQERRKIDNGNKNGQPELGPTNVRSIGFQPDHVLALHEKERYLEGLAKSVPGAGDAPVAPPGTSATAKHNPRGHRHRTSGLQKKLARARTLRWRSCSRERRPEAEDEDSQRSN